MIENALVESSEKLYDSDMLQFACALQRGKNRNRPGPSRVLQESRHKTCLGAGRGLLEAATKLLVVNLRGHEGIIRTFLRH